MISVKVTGFKEIIAKAKRYPIALRRESMVAAQDAGKELLRKMQNVVLSGNFAPHKRPYGNAILIASGRMFNSIRFIAEGTGGFVGIRGGGGYGGKGGGRYPSMASVRSFWKGKSKPPRGKRGGASVVQVAKWHESGNRGGAQPSRPFVSQTARYALVIIQKHYRGAAMRAWAGS